MFDLKRPCKNCPFRIGVGETFNLRRDRLDEIFSAVAFQCHKTLNGNPQQCAGAMSILHREGRDNQIMQVAQRLTGFDASKLDHSAVYATIDDAYRAHTGGPMSAPKTNNQSLKTHCPHGHPYEGSNLITMVVKKDGIDTGKRKRQCRACKAGSHPARKKPLAGDNANGSLDSSPMIGGRPTGPSVVGPMLAGSHRPIVSSTE